MSPEAYLHHVVRLREFPRVALQEPAVWFLDLPAVLERLAKDAELVANSVADGRHIERGEGIQEAGSQSAQAAVAQSRFDVQAEIVFQLQVEFGERFASCFGRAGVQQVLFQLLSRQVLGRQVIDELGVGRIVCFRRLAPALNQIVSHRVRKRHVDVVMTGRLNGLSVHVVEVFDRELFESLGRFGQRRPAERVGPSTFFFWRSSDRGLQRSGAVILPGRTGSGPAREVYVVIGAEIGGSSRTTDSGWPVWGRIHVRMGRPRRD